MADSLTVTLTVFQGLSIKMASVDLARWMLKRLQHDSILAAA